MGVLSHFLQSKPEPMKYLKGAQAAPKSARDENKREDPSRPQKEQRGPETRRDRRDAIDEEDRYNPLTPPTTRRAYDDAPSSSMPSVWAAVFSTSTKSRYFCTSLSSISLD